MHAIVLLTWLVGARMYRPSMGGDQHQAGPSYLTAGVGLSRD
jgi:hypothetical protein